MGINRGKQGGRGAKQREYYDGEQGETVSQRRESEPETRRTERA